MKNGFNWILITDIKYDEMIFLISDNLLLNKIDLFLYLLYFMDFNID